jgi:hypothetical protein
MQRWKKRTDRARLCKVKQHQLIFEAVYQGKGYHKVGELGMHLWTNSIIVYILNSRSMFSVTGAHSCTWLTALSACERCMYEQTARNQQPAYNESRTF